MKRIFLIFTVALVSIGLAGCDMITPAQVEQISEEFCRENPTSEICQGDAVGDLEDDVILNVFNTIIDEYNDDTNTTFCDDYFSVTNPDLLDACRTSREGLVPEDFTDFNDYTVIGVEKQITLSTQDVYEITIISEDLTVEVVFSIGLVNVEGIMYISSWSFEVNETSPTEHDVSLEDAEAFFEQFIADYVNPEISSEEVCALYFTGEDAEGCVDGRESSLALNISIIMNAIDASTDPGTFDIELAIDDDDNDVTIELAQVSFSYDEDGNIVMQFIHDEDPGEPDNWLDADDAFAVIAEYLDDYSDDAVSNDEFNAKYFEGYMDWDFFLNRNDDKTKGVTYTLIFVEDPTEEPLDYLVVTLQRNYEGEAKTIVVRARIYDLGDGTYSFDILFEEESGLDYDMLFAYMLDFTADYQDSEISDDDICQMYFPNDDLDECVAQRQEFMSSGVAISVLEFNIVREYYEVIFEYDVDGEVTTQSAFVNFFFDEDHVLHFEFSDLGFDEIDYYDALAFMQNFLFQYNNFGIPSYDVCVQFFEGDSYDECVMRREIEMEEGITFTDFELFNDGYGYQIDLHYQDALGETTTKHFEAHFYYDEDGELKLELFEHFELIPYEIIYPYLEDMVLDFNNLSIDSETFCAIYFGPDTIPGCVEHREKVLSEGFSVSLSFLAPEYDHYRIELEYSIPGADSWFESFNAFFYFDEDDNLLVDFRGDGPEAFPYDEAYNYFQMLIADFSDPTMSDEGFCSLYFPGSGDFCLWDRSLMPLEDMDISLVTFDFDGYSFVAQIMFENNVTGDIDYHTVYLDFYWDEYGNVAMHLNEEPMVDFLNYSDSVGVIQQFFTDLADPTVTDDQIDAWYFDYQMGPGALMDRFDILTNGYIVLVSDVLDPSNADGQDYLEVVVDTFDTTGLISTNTLWIRVMALPSGYYMLDFDFNDPGDKLELTYDEAFDLITLFMDDYSDESILSYDVCSTYFDAYDYPNCIVKRDQEIADGVTIDFVGLDEPVPGEFFVELDYYDFDGLFMYTDYLRVDFFIAEMGETKMHIDLFDPAFAFPIEDALLYVNALTTTFMDPSITTSDYCDMYGFIIDNCETLRDDIFDNSGYLYFSNLYNEVDNLFYFEYGYQIADGDVAVYKGLMLEFSYDEFGNIIVFPHDVPNPDFIYANFPEAQAYWLLYLQDYINPTIPTEVLVDTYFGGFVDDHYYDVRADDLARGVTFNPVDVVFDDPYFADGIDWITVTYTFTTGAVDDTLTEYFRVMIFPDGYHQIELESFYPEVVEYSVANEMFQNYVTDLFDPGISNELFCATYSEDWAYPECNDLRDDLLSNYAYADIADFYFNDYMFTYQGVIDFYDVDDSLMDTKTFDVIFWFDIDGLLKMELFESFDGEFDPLYDDLYDLIMDYPVEFTDLTINSVDFCNMYFPSEPDCVVTRDDMLASSTLYVSIEEFYSHPDCDMRGYCTEDLMVYEALIVYNMGSNDFISQRVEVIPVYDVDGNLHIELYVVRTESSVPLGAVLLDESDALYYLNAFASDYSNPAVSYEDFCALYFNGNSHCMDDRFEIIEMGGNVTFVGLTVDFDDDGLPFLVVEFELTMDGDTMTAFANLRVWQIDPVNVFFEWVNVDDIPVV